MVKDKKFYKTLLLIGLPVAFQSLISLGVVFLDNIMVGSIPENTELAIAAVAQANIISTFFTFMVRGLSGGASLMISQYWGKKDMEKIKRIFSIIFTIGLSVSVVGVSLIFAFPRAFMSFTTDKSVIIGEGAKYLRIICLSYIFYLLSDTFTAMLRCVEIVKVTLYISISSLFVNLFFNYMLIFGKFGMPALGIQGAAIATVITRITEFTIMAVFTFKVQKRLPLKIRDLFTHEKQMWLDYFKYGLPIMFGDMQWGFVSIFRAMIVGHYGATEEITKQMISSYSIAEVIMQLAQIFTAGLGAAACVIIGKSVGAKEYDNTRKYGKTLEILFASFGVLACTILFFARVPLVSLYKVDPFVAKTAKTFIAIGAFTLLGTFYHATCFTGINRGAGDSKFVFKVDMICGWVIVLPLLALNVFILKSPMPVVFLFTRIDQCFKWIIAFIRLRGKKWIRNVTRD